MPNPTRISLPRVNYNFDAKACVPVLTVRLLKMLCWLSSMQILP